MLRNAIDALENVQKPAALAAFSDDVLPTGPSQPRGFAFERGARESEHHALAASGEVYELTEQIRRTVEALGQRRPLVSAAESRKRVICCLEAERSIREDRDVALDFG